MNKGTIILSAITAFIIGFGSSITSAVVEAKGSLPSGATWLVALFGALVVAAKDNRALMKLPSPEDTGDKPATKLPLLLLAGLLSFGAVGVVVTGCSTSQQRIAFNSIATVQTVTVAAYDGYVAQVVAGRIPTNDVPLVSKRFNQFQASSLLALDAVNFNTNALAPESLQVLSKDLLNLIVTITPKK